MVLRALTYMRALGGDGMRRVAERAVLNARYLAALVRPEYDIPYDRPCMHEFVASARPLKQRNGVRAMDVAKALLDRGFHSPTVYFPLIVEEALMVEPTETQSRETVEALAHRHCSISPGDDPDAVKASPVRTPVGRLDEARAARTLDVNWDTV